MRLRKFFVSCALFAAVLAGALPANAQSVIRDTEIEADMAEWFKPLFAAAGMSPDQVNIVIVNDDQVNAFVAGGANIFLYTGLLQKTENPGEVIGVVAHELGHVTGGHLIRGQERMEQASYESILAMILGAGAAVATGDGGAAATIGMGGNSMAMRRFLTYSRAFESSADQAALKFLDKAQLNPEGLESFMHKLEGQELRPESQQAQYVRTHPLTRDRIDAINLRVGQSPYKGKAYPGEWNSQHKMMLAKLMGFISPQQVAWTYDDRDNSLPSLSARAIAAYRTNDVAKALKLSDQLLAAAPDNPYFLELKGQMLMDFGRVREAVPYYQKAIAAKPNAPLIRTALAHAQIETAGNDKSKLEEAIRNLNLAAKDDPKSSRIHRLLATAYGRSGDEPRAKLHLAEEALLQNKLRYAKSQVESAMPGLKSGSADWIRANDILNYVRSERDRDGDGKIDNDEEDGSDRARRRSYAG